jgi:hypothetical protein
MIDVDRTYLMKVGQSYSVGALVGGPVAVISALIAALGLRGTVVVPILVVGPLVRGAMVSAVAGCALVGCALG